jgi:hemoglobin
MATDVSSPADVEELVRRFYGAVAQDELLVPMFNDVARVDWSEHLPKLTAFWCRALFGTPGYQGNPYAKHRAIHAQAPFTAEHFARWLELFEETVDHGWSGERAESMKALALRVAEVHSRQLVGAPVELGARLEIIP